MFDILTNGSIRLSRLRTITVFIPTCWHFIRQYRLLVKKRNDYCNMRNNYMSRSGRQYKRKIGKISMFAICSYQNLDLWRKTLSLAATGKGRRSPSRTSRLTWKYWEKKREIPQRSRSNYSAALMHGLLRTITILYRLDSECIVW